MIEVIVVTAIMVVLLSVTAVSLTPLLNPPAAAARRGQAPELAREVAIESGAMVVLVVADSAGGVQPLARLPDGRTVGGDFDPLTGSPLVR